MRRRSRVTAFGAGIIGIVVIAAACYLVFGGSLPFSGSSFVLKAAFTTQTQLQIPSPVRIAGVNVGQVTSVQRVSHGSDAAIVTMNINPSGLPIHAGATARIRARIFLEGNFYVELSPGSPSAPILQSNSTLPAASTSGPVQLDRVLAALNADARANLQTLLIGFGSTLSLPPTAAQNAASDSSGQRTPVRARRYRHTRGLIRRLIMVTDREGVVLASSARGLRAPAACSRSHVGRSASGYGY